MESARVGFVGAGLGVQAVSELAEVAAGADGVLLMKKDVAVCLQQAAERGVDPGLLIEVVRRGRLPLI